VHEAAQTPGALIAEALVEHTGCAGAAAHSQARVGACSDRLEEQVDELLEEGLRTRRNWPRS
jgi:hypothetical protein